MSLSSINQLLSSQLSDESRRDEQAPVLHAEVNELSTRSGLPKLQELPGLSSLSEILEQKEKKDEHMVERLDALIRNHTEVLRRNRHDLNAKLARGLAYLEKGKLAERGLIYYAKAVRDISQVLAKNQTSLQTLYSRGIAYQHLGQMGKAIGDFTEVLRHDPQHAHAAFARAACQNIIGKFSQAIDDYELALKNDGLLTQEIQPGRPLSISKLEALNSPKASATFFPNEFSSTNTTSATSKSIFRRLTSPKNKQKRQIQPELKNKKLQSAPNLRLESKTLTRSTIRQRRVDITNSSNLDSDELCRLASLANKDGDPKKAMQLYDEALQKDVNHFKAQFNKGFLSYKLKKYDDAIEAYTRAIRIDSSNSLAFYNRGISRDKAGDVVGAIADFTIAIRSKQKLIQDMKTNSSDMETIVSFYYNRGVLYTKLAEYSRAAEDYTLALEGKPKHVRALINRAKCMLKIGRFQDALMDYNASLKIASDRSFRISALMGRAQVYQQLKDITSALKDTDEAMILMGSQGFEGLKYHTDDANFDESHRNIKHLSAAISKDQNNFSLFYERGMIKQELKQHSDAIGDFSSALKLISQRTEENHDDKQIKHKILIARAKSLKDTNDLYNALSDLSLVLRELPHEEEALVERSTILLSQGLHRLALKDYQTLRLLRPKDLELLFNVARCQEELVDIEKAIESYTVLLSLAPANSEAYFNRDFVLKKIEKLNEARNDMKVAQKKSWERIGEVQ